MKEPGSWLNILFGSQLENVQKVGAQSPTVADAPESSANGIVLRFVTFLHKQNIHILTISFCNLKRHLKNSCKGLQKE